MKRFLRNFITFVLILSMMLSSAAAGAYADSEPAVNGETAMIYCETTDEVIWEKHSDKEMNPASMTKLLTCLLAIEKLDLDQEVTITREATEVIPTKIYLQEGEVVTVRDLLHAALLESANDAAMALGIATAGSIKDFAKMMNKRVEKIGCTNTHFVNPSGLYGKGQHSSARDMALIAAEAFNNKTLKKIAGTLQYTIGKTNKSEARALENGNLFLNGGTKELPSGDIKVKKYDGVFGGKTGTTEEAVATMTVGMNHEGLELYVVIMGTTMEKRFSDIKKLLDYGKENVCPYVVFKKGDLFDDAKLTHGAVNKVAGQAAYDGIINLPEGASASLVTVKTVYEEELKAPIKQGDRLGVAEIYLADEMVREIRLVAAEDVEEGWFLSPYGITNMQTVLIFSGAGLILAFIITIFTLRAINMKKKKLRRQQRIMEAARREMEREQSMKQRGWPY
jgi:D-alanyl-D-alanine carboxypeptidase